MSQQLYQERLRRIETAAHLGVPDRVPVVLFGEFFSCRYCGMKVSEYIWGGDRAREVLQETIEDFGADGVLLPSPNHPLLYVLSWPTKVLLPGRDLPDDVMYQFNEREPIMALEDYDFIIRHGLNAFIPKVIERCVDFIPADEVYQEVERLIEQRVKDVEEWKKQGVPVFCALCDGPPFEFFSAARTMSQFFIDLYRYPQKVINAMDAAMPDVIENGIQAVKATGINRVFLDGNRECGAFLSLDKYEKFSHPWRRQQIQAYLDASIEVMLHYDQDWTTNLPYYRKFPAGKISLHTDGDTDLFQAKDILGDRIALKGDVPPILLSLGSPEEVDAYCQRLITEVGRGGGFILSQGCEVPIDARPDNLRTMVEAARKYGVYH